MVDKNKYLCTYICFSMLFLAGCSSASNQRVNRMNRADNKQLEKRIDDLSGKMNLLVHDTNILHNELEEVKTSHKTLQQKIEGLEATLSNWNERIVNLTTLTKTPEIVQPPAEETSVEPQSPIPERSKPSDIPASAIEKTENVEVPLAVAKGFWDAMNAKDIQAVRLHATRESGDKLQMKDTDTTGNGTVTFGEVKMEDNKATIETALQTHNGTTTPEIPMQTILVKEDGLWKVDAEQTMMSVFGGAMGEMIQGLGKAMEEGLGKGMEEVGRSMAEGMQKGIEVMTQTGAAMPDTTPPQPETPVTTEIREQKKGEDLQKSPDEMTQAIEAKPDVTSQKQETAARSEPASRELFLKDTIAQLAQTEFPQNKGIQWNILSFEHKAHLTNVEVEPTPATLDYPRYKFVVSFKNPETPRIIGMSCFKDGQYHLLEMKKRSTW